MTFVCYFACRSLLKRIFFIFILKKHSLKTPTVTEHSLCDEWGYSVEAIYSGTDYDCDSEDEKTWHILLWVEDSFCGKTKVCIDFELNVFGFFLVSYNKSTKLV